jgi:hypothetical protein
MKRLLSLILLISYTATAQVKFHTKGQPAEYDGFLFTPEKEQEVRYKLMDLDYYKSLDSSRIREIDLYKQENKLLEEKLVLYKSTNEELFKRSMDVTNSTFWTGFWYFLLGAGVTTLITYGVNSR